VHVRKKLLSEVMCRIMAMTGINYEDYCKRFPKSFHCICLCLMGLIMEANYGRMLSGM
jgi:hypothetical protein